MSGPMDPGRLAHIRRMVEDNPWGLTREQRNELLADRDHWEAEARRYRSRCPVTAEDVEAKWPTWAPAESAVRRWLQTQDALVVAHARPRVHDAGFGAWAREIADMCNAVSENTSLGCPLDILAALTAAEGGPTDG